jgi:hypothetical protein
MLYESVGIGQMALARFPLAQDFPELKWIHRAEGLSMHYTIKSRSLHFAKALYTFIEHKTNKQFLTTKLHT